MNNLPAGESEMSGHRAGGIGSQNMVTLTTKPSDLESTSSGINPKELPPVNDASNEQNAAQSSPPSVGMHVLGAAGYVLSILVSVPIYILTLPLTAIYKLSQSSGNKEVVYQSMREAHTLAALPFFFGMQMLNLAKTGVKQDIHTFISDHVNPLIEDSVKREAIVKEKIAEARELMLEAAELQKKNLKNPDPRTLETARALYKKANNCFIEADTFTGKGNPPEKPVFLKEALTDFLISWRSLASDEELPQERLQRRFQTVGIDPNEATIKARLELAVHRRTLREIYNYYKNPGTGTKFPEDVQQNLKTLLTEFKTAASNEKDPTKKGLLQANYCEAVILAYIYADDNEKKKIGTTNNFLEEIKKDQAWETTYPRLAILASLLPSTLKVNTEFLKTVYGKVTNPNFSPEDLLDLLTYKNELIRIRQQSERDFYEATPTKTKDEKLLISEIAVKSTLLIQAIDKRRGETTKLEKIYLTDSLMGVLLEEASTSATASEINKRWPEEKKALLAIINQTS